VIEIVKFTLIAGVESGKEFLREVFPIAPGSLMKITMDHDLVSLRFQIPKPPHETVIFRGRAVVMVIRNYQQGANRNSVAGKLRHNFRHRCSSRWCYVVHGDDQSFAIGFRRKREHGRQRCRSGAGHAGFSISTREQTSLIATAPSEGFRQIPHPSLAARTTGTSGGVPSLSVLGSL
jgi:hypothetical protein